MKIFKHYLLSITLFIFLQGIVSAQKANESSADIQILFEKLFYAQSNSSKDSLNVLILSKLELHLFDDKNDFSVFDKIKNLNLVSSEDQYLYIFTWVIQYSDKKFKYFGFIKYYDKESQKYYVEKLNHNSKERKDITNKIILLEDWYGAGYYNLIYKKYKNKRQYVLLGWDGNNNFTNKKIIDILVLEDGEIPVLGENVFNTEKGFKKRIIFEYAEGVNMTLKYDEKRKMIIWDHLSPSRQELTGHYEYYGPDMTFDGLTFEKGVWKFISDIDLR